MQFNIRSHNALTLVLMLYFSAVLYIKRFDGGGHVTLIPLVPMETICTYTSEHSHYVHACMVEKIT